MRALIILVIYFLATATASCKSSQAIAMNDYRNKAKFSARIISGQTAKTGEFPWQVGVYITLTSSSSFCGGALISDQWILTASHCVDGVTEFILYIGGITLDSSEIGRIVLTVAGSNGIKHPAYNNTHLNNDIGLIRLNYPVPFTSTIKPIRLAKRGTRLAPGVNVVVCGFGKTRNDDNALSMNLKWVQLTTISNERCSQFYPDTIIESTLCAVGMRERSSCSGDSGGPLVSYENGTYIHQGIISFVHLDGCTTGKPSGYVRTASMLDWIAATTGLDV